MNRADHFGIEVDRDGIVLGVPQALADFASYIEVCGVPWRVRGDRIVPSSASEEARAWLRVTPDCDGCTGDRCPGACPILEGERTNADAERVETLRKALAALTAKSTKCGELSDKLRHLRDVHSELCDRHESLLEALAVDTTEDGLARVRELLAIEKQRTRIDSIHA